jgi:hypothetical protein
MTAWEPQVGEDVVVIGGTYREEARTRRVERLTKTTIVVEDEACRFRREAPAGTGEYPEFRGKGGDAWNSPPSILHPASFRARRVLAETEEREAKIEMRQLAEGLEKDPRRPGGVHQLHEGIKRLERAVAAMDAIHEERPDLFRRRESLR